MSHCICILSILRVASPGFSIYSDDQCNTTPISRSVYETACTVSNDDNNDNESGIDDTQYVPIFLNPPPSTATTPMPQGEAATVATNFYCTATAPTQKPAFAPTAFPTSASPAKVDIALTQVL